jgi:putative integral membrane protein (TIGR02587 family)
VQSGTAGLASHARGADRDFLIGLARAFGGALIFALPMLMTMEMWSLATAMSDRRLALLLLVLLPVLVGLSHSVGFEETSGLADDLLDAFVAFGVGTVASAFVLVLFGVIGRGMPLDELVGKVALQAVPGSIGALLARSQLGAAIDERDRGHQQEGYWGELFLMGVGALFLALNVAPTEEMVLIAHLMTPWHAAVLILTSVGVMHAFVYSVEFRGHSRLPEGVTHLRAFAHFTIAGYAVALLISAYILWSFGRSDGLALLENVKMTTVLAFPAALGAAAARLIL